MNNNYDVQIPIIFSISGHMDVDQYTIEIIKKTCIEIFKKYLNAYPNTNIILMSALAPGADQAAATALLDLKNEYKNRVKLISILPCGLEKYKKYSFDTITDENIKKSTLSNYNRLYNESDWKCNLDEMYNTLDESEKNYNFENKMRRLGGFLIANSHVLLSAWDGIDAQKTKNGGTADIVRMAHDGIDDDVNIMINHTNYLDVIENCLICQIVTPRTKLTSNSQLPVIYYVPQMILDNTDTNRCSDSKVKYCNGNWVGTKQLPNQYSKIFEKIEKYNRNLMMYIKDKPSSDINELETVKNEIDFIDKYQKYKFDDDKNYLKKYKKDTKKRIMRLEIINLKRKLFFEKNKDIEQELEIKRYNLFKINNLIDKPEKECNLSIERLDELKKSFENAVLISRSLKYEKTTARYEVADHIAKKERDNNHKNMMINLIIVALTNLFLALYLIPHGTTKFIIVYAALLLLQYVLYTIHIRKHIQSNFLEYRVLAETLRIHYYWLICGIEPTCCKNIYETRNNTQWIDYAIKAWNNPMMKDKEYINDINKKLDFVECSWIIGQKKYHISKDDKNRKKIKFGKTIGKITFLIGFLISMTVIIVEWLDPQILNKIIYTSLILKAYQVDLSTLFKLSIAISELLFFSTSTYISKIIYGGNIEEISAKKKLFETAENRIISIKNAKDNESSINARIKLFNELGKQCIAEVNGWYNQHYKKGMDSIFKDKNMD